MHNSNYFRPRIVGVCVAEPLIFCARIPLSGLLDFVVENRVPMKKRWFRSLDPMISKRPDFAQVPARRVLAEHEVMMLRNRFPEVKIFHFGYCIRNASEWTSSGNVRSATVRSANVFVGSASESNYQMVFQKTFQDLFEGDSSVCTRRAWFSNISFSVVSCQSGHWGRNQCDVTLVAKCV